MHGADDTHSIQFRAPDHVIHRTNFSHWILAKFSMSYWSCPLFILMGVESREALLACPKMPLSVFWSPGENIKIYLINCVTRNCCDQNILILAPDGLLKSSQAAL